MALPVKSIRHYYGYYGRVLNFVAPATIIQNGRYRERSGQHWSPQREAPTIYGGRNCEPSSFYILYVRWNRLHVGVSWCRKDPLALVYNGFT